MCLLKFIKKHKENIQLLANLAAMISIIVTILLFNCQQKIIQESELASIKALTETLKNEIDINLDFLSYFETQKEMFKATNEITGDQYSTIILKDAINQKIGDEDTKKIMMDVYLKMSIVNRALERIQIIYIAPTHEQYMTMRLAKNQTIDVISNQNKYILNKLSLLKSYLNE